MKLTYTIQVCNESRELYSLLNFLTKVIDDEDDINVVVDVDHTTDKVELVLKEFKDRINIFMRPFDDFCKNSQFHADNATGDYIFGLDADEMPQELLIKNIKKIIEESGAEIIAIPRINIHPGATREFIEKSNFRINDVGWINWPDFQMRIYKKCDYIKWTEELHSKLTGSDKVIGVQAEPKLALWHIKSIEKQESRWAEGGDFKTPEGNLYDMLM
jgi:hypothetical protein